MPLLCARTALDSVSEGFLVIDRQWRILFANAAAADFTALTPAAMLGRTLWELFPEAPTRRFGSEYRRAFAEHVPVCFEEFYPDPLNRWYEVRAYPCAQGLSIFFRDVSARRAVEEALRVNQIKYSVLFHSLPVGITLTDADGNIVETNEQSKRLMGVTDASLRDRNIRDGGWRLTRRDGTPMPPAEFASTRALLEGRTVQGNEAGLVHPDGRETWIRASAAPMPLEGYGVVIGLVDVTDQINTEQALENARREAVAQKAHLDAVIDALPTGLAIIDGDQDTIRVNDAFQRIWGSRPIVQHTSQGPRYAACPRPICDGPCPVAGLITEVDGNGCGRRFVLNSAAPIIRGHGNPSGCAVVIQDVTRLVETERALVASQAALERSNVELAAANDALRTSNDTLELRVAERTADLERRTQQLRALAGDLTRVEEQERQRIAQVIHDHLQQRLSVARMNLASASARARSATLRQALADVDALVGESLEITRTLTAELSPPILRRSGLAAALRWLGRWAEQQLGVSVEVEADDVAVADEQVRLTLFRSARELLFNVAKHAATGHAHVRLARAEDGRARLVVSDHGTGFDPEDVRAREGVSGGFGLFSVRERLELLGGSLDISSAPGSGTIVTIVAPPAGAAAAEAPQS